MARSTEVSPSDGIAERLLLVFAAAAALAAVDLSTKLALETPPWAYHERSPAWVGFCLVALVGVGALAFVPSLTVAAAAGIMSGGVLGNLLSAQWNDSRVPNPLLFGSPTGGVAFNAADLFVLLGVMILIPALMGFAIHHRERLRPPSPLERRLQRWLGL